MLKLVETVTNALKSPVVQRVVEKQVHAGDLVVLRYLNGANEVFARQGISIPFFIQRELLKENTPIQRIG